MTSVSYISLLLSSVLLLCIASMTFLIFFPSLLYRIPLSSSQHPQDCEEEVGRTTDDPVVMEAVLNRLQVLQDKAISQGVYALESKVRILCVCLYVCIFICV
jgi:hypothetical protein